MGGFLKWSICLFLERNNSAVISDNARYRLKKEETFMVQTGLKSLKISHWVTLTPIHPLSRTTVYRLRRNITAWLCSTDFCDRHQSTEKHTEVRHTHHNGWYIMSTFRMIPNLLYYLQMTNSSIAMHLNWFFSKNKRIDYFRKPINKKLKILYLNFLF